MSHVWQLQDAQNQLSEIIDSAEKFGAQFINYQGKAKAVMLSMAKYRQLTNHKNFPTIAALWSVIRFRER